MTAFNPGAAAVIRGGPARIEATMLRDRIATLDDKATSLCTRLAREQVQRERVEADLVAEVERREWCEARLREHVAAGRRT